jgi:hypothetical protein
VPAHLGPSPVMPSMSAREDNKNSACLVLRVASLLLAMRRLLLRFLCLPNLLFLCLERQRRLLLPCLICASKLCFRVLLRRELQQAEARCNHTSTSRAESCSFSVSSRPTARNGRTFRGGCYGSDTTKYKTRGVVQQSQQRFPVGQASSVVRVRQQCLLSPVYQVNRQQPHKAIEDAKRVLKNAHLSSLAQAEPWSTTVRRAQAKWWGSGLRQSNTVYRARWGRR